MTPSTRRESHSGLSVAGARRIAAGNVEMALDMFTTNKTAVLTMIEKFKDSLEKLENMIRDGKVKEITAELEKAKELRAGMYAVKS